MLLPLALIIIGFAACQKEFSTIGKPAPTSNLPLADTTLIGDSTNFYDITINGTRQLHIVNYNTDALTGANGDSLNDIIQTYDFYADTSGDATFEFNKGYIKRVPSDSSFLSLNQKLITEFLPGFYTYTNDFNTVDGIVIRFKDSTGKQWSTLQETADQTNSIFQIVTQLNLDPDYSSTGISHGIHLYCKFNCILYDDEGNSLKVTNGRLGISLWLQ